MMKKKTPYISNPFNDERIGGTRYDSFSSKDMNLYTRKMAMFISKSIIRLSSVPASFQHYGMVESRILQILALQQLLVVTAL
jgi:hypothetical protein